MGAKIIRPTLFVDVAFKLFPEGLYLLKGFVDVKCKFVCLEVGNFKFDGSGLIF